MQVQVCEAPDVLCACGPKGGVCTGCLDHGVHGKMPGKTLYPDPQLVASSLLFMCVMSHMIDGLHQLVSKERKQNKRRISWEGAVSRVLELVRASTYDVPSNSRCQIPNY